MSLVYKHRLMYCNLMLLHRNNRGSNLIVQCIYVLVVQGTLYKMAVIFILIIVFLFKIILALFVWRLFKPVHIDVVLPNAPAAFAWNPPNFSWTEYPIFFNPFISITPIEPLMSSGSWLTLHYCEMYYLTAVNYDPATTDIIFIRVNIYPGTGEGGFQLIFLPIHVTRVTI